MHFKKKYLYLCVLVYLTHVNESIYLSEFLLNIIRNLSLDTVLFIWYSNVKHTFLLTMMPLLRGKMKVFAWET